MEDLKKGAVYTVSALTKEIKELLEETHPFVWITGEISNCFTPASGHTYFSLKDAVAVINCAMFYNQKRKLKFDLKNGMEITGMARLSVYAPRGSYQLVFEHLEPKGAGSLQAAFEQLKEKLAKEGLFDERHKKPIPFLPGRVGIVTSATGAAIRDIINISKRRFPGCRLEIAPVTVQGGKAEQEIAEALEMLNTRGRSDVIIVARGGGSFEDLAAFNTETVARAVFNSRIPVISGVGHETDVTICDFAADRRAPTPSAAAELALPDKTHLEKRVYEYRAKLQGGMNTCLRNFRKHLTDLHSRLKSPERVIDSLRLRIEDLNLRMHACIRHLIAAKQSGKDGLAARLDALNPMEVLKRGYSITLRHDDGTIVSNAGRTKTGDVLETILSDGKVISRVENKNG